MAAAVAGTALAADGAVLLTLEDRIAAQKAIETVFWSHRTWPADNAQPKPALGTVMTSDALRARVDDYLRKSSALEAFWQRPITPSQLQAELDRMARNSRDPQVLSE